MGGMADSTNDDDDDVCVEGWRLFDAMADSRPATSGARHIGFMFAMAMVRSGPLLVWVVTFTPSPGKGRVNVEAMKMADHHTASSTVLMAYACQETAIGSMLLTLATPAFVVWTLGAARCLHWREWLFRTAIETVRPPLLCSTVPSEWHCLMTSRVCSSPTLGTM